MLPKGSIIKIINHYAHYYEADIQSALLEFFDLKDKSDIARIEWDDMTEGLFNEWLVYDYRLSNGRTLLEDFCVNNPCQLSDNNMDLYNCLRLTQQYGFFEVMSVKLDQGLSLRNLYTGEKYKVKERSATHTLKPGFLIYNRVAKLNDRWELVGADSPYLPIHLTDRFRQLFLKDKPEEITVKTTYQWMKSKDQKDYKETDLVPAEARAELGNLLKSTGLQKFVSVDTIVKWCQREGELDNIFEITSLIFSLAENLADQRSLDKLLSAVQDVYNTTPQKILGGKSPQEAISEDPNYVPELISDLRVIGGEKWLKELNKAHDFLHKQNFYRAARAFEKVFHYLLEEKTACADIYRIFANKAVAHLACGENERGLKMIELALELNPNYDFAQKLRKKCENSDYNQSRSLVHSPTINKKKGSKKYFDLIKQSSKSKNNIKNDPAVKYYNYLNGLGINFATKKTTTSRLTTI